MSNVQSFPNISTCVLYKTNGAVFLPKHVGNSPSRMRTNVAKLRIKEKVSIFTAGLHSFKPLGLLLHKNQFSTYVTPEKLNKSLKFRTKKVPACAVQTVNFSDLKCILKSHFGKVVSVLQTDQNQVFTRGQKMV